LFYAGRVPTPSFPKPAHIHFGCFFIWAGLEPALTPPSIRIQGENVRLHRSNLRAKPSPAAIFFKRYMIELSGESFSCNLQPVGEILPFDEDNIRWTGIKMRNRSANKGMRRAK